MSPASRRSRLAVPGMIAMLAAGLLPAVALAVDPVAVDDTFTVPVGAGVTVLDVLANDTDADPGDELTIVSNTAAGHGTAFLNGGVLRYNPDNAFHGTDTFQYTIEDASFTQATATVTVIVNDPPVAVDDPASACMDPTAAGGSFPIPEDYHETGLNGDYFVL